MPSAHLPLDWHRILISIIFLLCFSLILIKIKQWLFYIPTKPKSTKNKQIITPSNQKYNDLLAKAENYKKEGNNYLSNNNLNKAYEQYTNAINLNLLTVNNAIYYSNRAFVSLKLENIGSALEDSNKAIQANPEYLKGYYRRASAHLLLFNYDKALEDLQLLLKHLPNDQELIMKIDKTKKQKRSKLFKEAIKSDTTQEQSNNQNNGNKQSIIERTLNTMTPEDNPNFKMISLPEDNKLTPSFIEDLIESMKSNIFLSKRNLIEIILQVKKFYDNQPSLIDIKVPSDKEITVCGDIHGQFYDLINIFTINGYPTESNPYLFNGDFVDRGSFSVECIITLLCYKALYPNHFHLARGNHEARNLNKLYGFENEVKAKYDNDVYDCFCELFCSLPLAHTINEKVLVVHGGLFSQNGITLDQIRNIDRFQEPPERGLMCELLWSDPSKIPGRQPSKRGIGICFGPDVAEDFLEHNSLDLLVRSHEMKYEGYEVEPNKKVITVFSAPNYCDQMGNKGAIIRFKGGDLKPKFIQFKEVKHPNVPSMNYASSWMFF